MLVEGKIYVVKAHAELGGEIAFSSRTKARAFRKEMTESDEYKPGLLTPTDGLITEVTTQYLMVQELLIRIFNRYNWSSLSTIIEPAISTKMK